MYSLLRAPLLRLLKAPERPPVEPVGYAAQIHELRPAPGLLAKQISVHLGSIGIAVTVEVIGWWYAPIEQWAVGLVAAALAVVTTVVAMGRYLLIRADYDLRYYIATDQALRIRRGAIFIEESTYTFANVQNVTLKRGPLDRLFGIANIEIETAGGSLADNTADSAAFHRGTVEGIEPGRAEDLRDHIVARMRSESSQAPEAEKATTRQQLLELQGCVDVIRSLNSHLIQHP